MMRLVANHASRTLCLAMCMMCLVGQAFADSTKLVAMPSFGDVEWFAITPNNLTVIYIADADTNGQRDLYSVPASGGTPVRLSGPMVSGGNVWDAQLSANGAYVVYRADQDTDGTPDLYSVPTGGPASSRVKLTEGLAAGAGATIYQISPDSVSVVYVAPALGAIGDLFSVPIVGPATNTTRLQSATALGRTASFEFSPDGTRVAYYTVDTNFVTPPVVRQLFSVGVHGPFDSSVELYSEADSSPCPFGCREGFLYSKISPDSTRVVYKTEIGSDVYSVPIGGPFAARVQLNTEASGRFGSRDFDISPDGNSVVYITGLNLGGIPVPEILYELFSVPIAGPASASVQLNGPMVAGGDVALHPARDCCPLPFQISPDSTRVVYSANQDDATEFELYSVPTAGPASAGVKLNGPHPLDGDVLSFRISRDGSRVMYAGDQETLDVLELYGVPIAGPPASGVKLNVPVVGQGLDPYEIAPFVVDADGDHVVYRASQVTDQYELFRVPVAGPASASEKLNGALTSGGEVLRSMTRDGNFGTVPAFDISPDGLRIIYLADEDTDQVVELYSFVSVVPPTIPEDLVVDFGAPHGLWRVQDGGIWSPVHGLSPEAIVTGDLDGNGLDDLVVNFGPGIGVYAWMNHATWTFIHSLSPSRMITGDFDNTGQDDVVFDFPGFGLWRFNNNASWVSLHPLNAAHLAVGNLDATGGDEILVSFAGAGLWRHSDTSGWTFLHGLDVALLLTVDLDGNSADDVVVEFPGLGLWSYVNLTTWAPVHSLAPAHIAAGDLDNNGLAELVVDFGPGLGIYILRNGTTWTFLHPFTSEGLLLADVDGDGIDEVVIDFGPGVGLWAYVNDSTWELVHGLSPEAMVAGRFH